MDELCYLSLLDAAELIRSGRLSPVELLEATLARIAALDGRLLSYLTVCSDQARAAARQAEAEIAAGRYRGPLHGIPIGMKDLFATKGIATTCASPALSDWIPDHDATAVGKLAEAGAVMVGKLNMTEGALSGYHPSLPIPCNPWDLERHASGSSSGSGVAVAAGLCFAATATDTGGSIRGPAAWNGVVGLKPTYGRVSRAGVFPLAMTLDHVGVLTRRAADAAAVFEAMAGFDALDPTSLREPVPACLAGIADGIVDVRIGIDRSYIKGGCIPELADAVAAVGEVLAAAGASLVPVDLPPLEGVLEAWFPLCAAEALVAHQATFPSKASSYGRMFRSLLEKGASLSAADYVRAHVRRTEFGGRLKAVFTQVDAILCPGSFSPALPAAAIDPEGILSQDLAPFMRFTSPFNFSGSPTLSFPCGFSAEGLPYGAQVVGRHLEEPLLLRIGHAYEHATEWHLRHPPLAE